MGNHINEFIKIREYLDEKISEKVEVFFCDIWDPLCKFILIKEVNKLIEKELAYMFPDILPMYLPKCKFRIFDGNVNNIEFGLQNYFNENTDLIFLGNRGIGDENFDLYCKISYDPRFEYIFVSKYGHGPNEKYEGCAEAYYDYVSGKATPLSMAYELAIDEGYIKE